MKSNFRKIAVLLCAALFFACSDKLDDLNIDQEHQTIAQEISAIPDKETFVSTEQAKEIAEAFFSKQSEGTIVKSSLKSFSEVSIETVKDHSDPLSMTEFYFPNNYSLWSSICTAATYYGSTAQYAIIGFKNSYVDQNRAPFLTTKWHQDVPFIS